MINCPYTGKSVDADACAATKRDGAVICVTCGTNLLTGQKIADAKEGAGEGTASLPLARIALVLALLIVVAGIVGAGILLASQNTIAEARRLYQEGKVLNAINVLQDHVSSNEGDADAYLMLGKLLWLNQDYTGALSAFDSAARANPNSENAAMLAVMASGRLQGDQARNKQIQALNRAVDNHGNTMDAQYLLGVAMGASEQYGELKSNLEPLLAQSGDDSDLVTYIAVADALEGDVNTARERLTEIQRNVDGDIALAILNSLNEDSETTRQQLQQALAAGDEVTELVAARLGLLYMSEGNYSAALSQFNQAQPKADAKSPTAFFRALCLQQTGDKANALIAFDQIVQLKTPFMTDAAAQLAMLYMDQGNVAKAEESIRAALSSGKGTARLYTIKGRIFVSKGDIPQGQNAFRQAMNLDPNYPAAYLENGLAYIARGITQEGVKQLRKYIELRTALGQDNEVVEVTMLVEQLEESLSN